MKRGTQIAYVPMHADGDLDHPDVEFGFITSVRDDAAFCRYWRKGQAGQLRTVANSELTPLDMLVECKSIGPSVVDQILKELQ